MDEYDSDSQEGHNDPSQPWPFEQQTASSSASARDPDVIRLHEHHRYEEQVRADAYLRPYLPRQPRSLSGIAIRAFCLGIAAASSLSIAAGILIFTDSPAWRPPFFVLALATFHFLEFWTTAEANTRIVTTDSFLLTANWPHYAIAHSFAFTESLLVSVFFPTRCWSPFGLGPVLLCLGLVITAVGQFIRSMAMLHAGSNFNHEVQWYKSESHELVTTGIYKYFRHPSYFGFFWWGLGTQLVLGNVISFFIYTGVLWWFFNRRIRYEEAMLVSFFKDDYVQYRARVSTWIPFIR
ncbi:hypothetical protein VHEMI02054 [[Torrubiella] hemipterigena]|uniref:Protein-S-isoprenylcysteine O-methyltransferase n=1 Tax=[Torrubiella] hemipterigena TaxID=1531966 RepID=A0A0A1SUP6_9HYPO|nr:hypothetical protein VHEMI02054 [[Torrubiella] hemipterigena]